MIIRVTQASREEAPRGKPLPRRRAIARQSGTVAPGEHPETEHGRRADVEPLSVLFPCAERSLFYCSHTKTTVSSRCHGDIGLTYFPRGAQKKVDATNRKANGKALRAGDPTLPLTGPLASASSLVGDLHAPASHWRPPSRPIRPPVGRADALERAP